MGERRRVELGGVHRKEQESRNGIGNYEKNKGKLERKTISKGGIKR